MKTQFKHIITEKGGATIAYRFVNESRTRMDLGIAYCSPSEKNFSKKKGRLISEGRMNAKRGHGRISVERIDISGRVEEFPRHLTDKEALDNLPFLRTRRHRSNNGPGISLGPVWWNDFYEEVLQQFKQASE